MSASSPSTGWNGRLGEAFNRNANASYPVALLRARDERPRDGRAANTSEEATFNADVIAQDALIATQKTRLTAELNLANEILQAIPRQLNEVNQLYSAMTGYNTKT